MSYFIFLALLYMFFLTSFVVLLLSYVGIVNQSGEGLVEEGVIEEFLMVNRSGLSR